PRLVEQIRIARNVVIAGRAAVDIGMHGDIVATGVEQHAAFDPAIDRTHGRARLNIHARRTLCARERRLHGQAVVLEGRRRTGRHRLRNAVVGGADHAADRGRAIAQRGWAANHLDLVGRERINRYEVIFAKVRGPAATRAVLDNADAVDVEAAD